MKNYYVESAAGWFVVTTQNKRKAYSVGNKEFGSRFVQNVREATKDEVDSYISQKSKDAMRDE